MKINPVFKWRTEGPNQQLENCTMSEGTGGSYLVKTMIKEDNLGLPAVGTLLDQHVARVWVTVNETMNKDHFTVHLAQLL